MIAGGTRPSTSVLIVDDAHFVRRMIRDILCNSGRYRVVGEAADGLEAIRLFEDLGPALVTMDITMPVLDGIAAARAILQRHPEARIVVCSTFAEERRVMEAIDAGVRDFITKPFTPEGVLRCLDAL